MGNSIFVLFFVWVILSFLFILLSRRLLSMRRKHTLRLHGLLWGIFLFSVILPFTADWHLITLRLFTDYTGGIRVEWFRAWTGEPMGTAFYFTSGLIRCMHGILSLLVGGWMIGAWIHIACGLAGYIEQVRALQRFSSPCREEHVLALLEDVRRKAGVHRSVSLRVVRPGMGLSPCTCWALRSRIYVGEEYLHGYDEEKIRLIFIHELIHIRHADNLLKLLALFVLSAFWFLPVTEKIYTALWEDIEFTCDDRVLDKMGDQSRRLYIETILDVAERTICTKDGWLARDCSSKLSPSGDLLLRRYQYMVNRHKMKHGERYIFPLIVAVLCLNVLCMSAFTIQNPDNYGVELSDPLLERAVCTYFSIEDPRDLTQDELARVHRIEYSVSAWQPLLSPMAGQYVLECSINGRGLGEIWTGETAKAAYHPGRMQKVLKDAYTEGKMNGCIDVSQRIDTRDLVLFPGLQSLILDDGAETAQKSKVPLHVPARSAGRMEPIG